MPALFVFPTDTTNNQIASFDEGGKRCLLNPAAELFMGSDLRINWTGEVCVTFLLNAGNE